jgi:hypothetical protein
LRRNEIGEDRRSRSRSGRGGDSLHEAQKQDRRHRREERHCGRRKRERSEADLVDGDLVACIGEAPDRQQEGDAAGEKQRLDQAERGRTRIEVCAHAGKRDGDSREHERASELRSDDRRDGERAHQIGKQLHGSCAIDVAAARPKHALKISLLIGSAPQ